MNHYHLKNTETDKHKPKPFKLLPKREIICDSTINSSIIPQISENEIIGTIHEKTKNRRRKKNEINDRKYTCPVCKKYYFSYPALYTHKRNKHNVIPITGKENMFKDVNYFSFDLTGKDISSVLINVLDKTREITRSFYNNPNSSLYIKDYNIEKAALNYFFVNKLSNRNEISTIPQNCKIDEALCWYVMHFAFVCNYDPYLELIIKYCILLHYYLNMRGWDYVEIYKRFKVIHYSKSGLFTSRFDCNLIPDMVNDFIEVFIKLEEEFMIEEKYLLDISHNLCNWLFINNLTNFKTVSSDYEQILH